MCIIDCLSTIVFILPLHLDYTKVIILILWWRNFQLEYWRTFQLVSTYYPYREDMGNPLDYDFSIQGDQREGITLSDFMYAANRSGTTDKVITLAFSHRLSRLQVTYTPEAGEALSGVTIQRAKATANINLGTGTANTLGATSDIRMYNDGGTFTAVIPAQDRDADGTFLTLLFEKEKKN